MRDSVTDPRDMFLLRESRAMIRSDPGPRIPDPRADESHCTGSGVFRGDEATSGAASKQSASDTGERNTETREQEKYCKNSKYGCYGRLQQEKEDLLRRSESLLYNT